jgi:hypothetical protein
VQDLRLPRTARRITGWANVVALGGLAMLGIVLADDNHWGASGVAYLAFAFMLYFLGTAAYRLAPKSPGQAVAHSLLGLRSIDLRNGFTVKKAWFGPGIVVVRAGKKRYRINGGLGSVTAIEKWLTRNQVGSTVSGCG